ncbi:M13 family metallopeptidase [Coralloluteibacterium stylophorae]|uniref:Peptidase n=1 Tax=Coralloluteibacterium stylophorae TaxID=1776034 RepID=A0A8J7VWT2_9GAMM|nr:peptidase [Coralloluteibacterium stylophorae]
MNARSLKPLALSLAVAFAVSACNGDDAATTESAATGAGDAPAATSAAPAAESLPPLARFEVADLDTSKNVCDDLDAFVNAKWLAANPVPGDRTSWGSFEMLDERAKAVTRGLAEDAAANGDSGVEKLVGDFWASGMDEASIEQAGLAPIQPLLSDIEALDSQEAIAGFLRDAHARGQGLLFGFGPEADFKNPDMNIAYAAPAGLGLPDKTYYFDEDKSDKRAAYVDHIARVLELTGVAADAARTQAEAVMAFETRLAEASKSTEEMSRDVSLYYHPVSVAEADALTPNFEWSTFFESQGVEAPETFSLAVPGFHQEVSEMLAEVDPADWRAYLRFHAVDALSPYLPEAFAQENFAFYGRALAGQQEIEPRWKRVLDAVEGNVGEAMGQLYVRENFPPESKARMEELVGNLRGALKAHIQNLDWMSEETKQKALAKWESFTPKIGYPEKWRDWSGLDTSRDSYVANKLAADRFNYQWALSKIGEPVDRTEWGMTPQTVNAYYNPLANEIVFPAAILQPPFFDAEADDAFNYGGIGAVIGHEMTHGYDDQGSRFGPSGAFENWWTEADAQGFQARTGKLVRQFDEYVAIDDEHVNGNLTLGENIADLGGLAVAYDAMKGAQGEDFADPMTDGYSQDQRFFINWATVWRRNFTDDALKMRLKTDPHAPANFRAIGAPSNLPAFAAAFECKPGDAMVRSGDARVVIW